MLTLSHTVYIKLPLKKVFIKAKVGLIDSVGLAQNMHIGEMDEPHFWMPSCHFYRRTSDVSSLTYYTFWQQVLWILKNIHIKRVILHHHSLFMSACLINYLLFQFKACHGNLSNFVSRTSHSLFHQIKQNHESI